jgi:ferredoxin
VGGITVPKILYVTANRTVEFDEGTESNILAASIRHQVGVPYKCGGGICGTCRIHVLAGAENLSPVRKAEIRQLGDAIEHGYRLACQTFARGDCAVQWEGKHDDAEVSEKVRQFWESRT